MVSEADAKLIVSDGHDWSDIINRIVTEYQDTPGGAPPGRVVQGIIAAQQSPVAMSTGSGDFPSGDIGLHYRTDSEDMRWYIERYGHEPGTIEEWVNLITNATDKRQESGGYFSDWHAAAYGTTGRVTRDGMNDDMSEERQQYASGWYREYITSVGTTAGIIDQLQPGSVNIDPKTHRPVVFPAGEETTDADLVEDQYPNLDVSDVTGFGSDMVAALTNWLPRIGLFALGGVLVGVGVWQVSRG